MDRSTAENEVKDVLATFPVGAEELTITLSSPGPTGYLVTGKRTESGTTVIGKANPVQRSVAPGTPSSPAS